MYRIDWPNDVRHEMVGDQRFATKEGALRRCRDLWGGCFDLYLKADCEPDHYYCAPLHFTEPGRSSPRVIPVPYEVRYMAGGCGTGSTRGGVTWHILTTPNSPDNGGRDKALCGKRPRIQWSDSAKGQPATCPGCLKRLDAR